MSSRYLLTQLQALIEDDRSRDSLLRLLGEALGDGHRPLEKLDKATATLKAAKQLPDCFDPEAIDDYVQAVSVWQDSGLDVDDFEVALEWYSDSYEDWHEFVQDTRHVEDVITKHDAKILIEESLDEVLERAVKMALDEAVSDLKYRIEEHENE